MAADIFTKHCINGAKWLTLLPQIGHYASAEFKRTATARQWKNATAPNASDGSTANAVPEPTKQPKTDGCTANAVLSQRKPNSGTTILAESWSDSVVQNHSTCLFEFCCGKDSALGTAPNRDLVVRCTTSFDFTNKRNII